MSVLTNSSCFTALISSPSEEARSDAAGKSSVHDDRTIENTLSGLGVKWLRTVNSYDVSGMMKTLKEASDQIRFLFTDDISYEPTLLIPKKNDQMSTAEALARSRAVLGKLDPFTAEVIRPALEGLAEGLGWSRKDLNGAIRVAITGRQVGPPLYESLEVLGKEKGLKRIEKAQELLAGGRD